MGKRRFHKSIIKYVGFIAAVVTIIAGLINIIPVIREIASYYQFKDHKDELVMEIRILQGETKHPFENGLLLITLDRIIINGFGYAIEGKLNYSDETTYLRGEYQGTSRRFRDYIIQIIEITSEYTDFRIIKQ
jgi:hypothetical protein